MNETSNRYENPAYSNRVDNSQIAPFLPIPFRRCAIVNVLVIICREDQLKPDFHFQKRDLMIIFAYQSKAMGFRTVCFSSSSFAGDNSDRVKQAGILKVSPDHIRTFRRFPNDNNEMDNLHFEAVREIDRRTCGRQEIAAPDSDFPDFSKSFAKESVRALGNPSIHYFWPISLVRQEDSSPQTRTSLKVRRTYIRNYGTFGLCLKNDLGVDAKCAPPFTHSAATEQIFLRWGPRQSSTNRIRLGLVFDFISLFRVAIWNACDVGILDSLSLYQRFSAAIHNVSRKFDAALLDKIMSMQQYEGKLKYRVVGTAFLIPYPNGCKAFDGREIV